MTGAALAALPKAEIHVHLEGSASPALARAKAARHRRTIDDLLSDDGSDYRWSGFAGFLDAYDRVAALFRTPEDFADLARDYLTTVAADDGVYVEFFVSPETAALAGLDWPDYLGGIAGGVARARAETGIECRLIPCAVRQRGPDAALATARQVVGTPHPLVTGFGLAGDETRFAPSDFLPAFEVAGEAGLGLTAHAGEVCGADSVRATLDALPVSRIGHGVHAIDDPDLVARIAAEGIVLEVCPGSNIAIGLYPDRRAHPLKALADAGVRVTIGSDDPPFFATSLAAEYERTAAELGWSRPAMAALTRTALQAAFVDEATRQRLIARLDAAGG